MTPIRVSIISTVLIVAAGCASKPLTLQEPIGPLDSQAYSGAGDTTHGSLIVYSDTELFPAEPDYPSHTGYTLFTTTDELLQEVDNRGGPFGASPVTLSLPTGQYKVVAKASNHRLVSAWVVIRDGRTTVLDLNREVMPQGLIAREDWVRLPNGAIVGARSSELAER